MNISAITAILAGLVGVDAVLTDRCRNLVTQITNGSIKSSKLIDSNKHVRALDASDANLDCVVKVKDAVRDTYQISNGEAWRKVQKMTGFVKRAASNGRIHAGSLFDDMSYISPATLKIFLQHKKHGDGYCGDLTAEQVKKIAASDKRASVITPRCFAHFPNDVDFGKKGITRFQDKILEFYELDLVHDSWYTMRKAQLEHYRAAKGLKEDRCSGGFRVEKLSGKLISAIPKDCFANWLENNAQVLNPKKQLDKVTVDHVKAASAAAIEAGFKTIVGEDWKKVNKDVLDVLAQDPDLSHLLNYKAIHSGTKVNKDSFFYMPYFTQMRVLEVVKDLPDDLFAELLPAHIKNWDNSEICKSEKKQCKQYGCFNLVKDRSNVKALLANVPLHNCVDVSFNKLRDARTFGDHMTRQCYKEMDVDAARLADFEGVSEAVLQFVPPQLIRKAFSSDWEAHAQDFIDLKGKSSKHASIWRGVLANPKVCRDLITPKVFKVLRENKMLGALAGFSSQCCRQIKFLPSLSDAEIHAFGPGVYSAFTKADKRLISFEKSTAEQLGNTSSQVADVADHYAAEVADVAGYSVELVGKLHESWFRAFPAATYATFTAEQVAAVRAEHLAAVCADKWANLSAAAQKALTPEQVTAIGSKCDDEKAAVAALKKFGLSEDGQKALKAREEALEGGAMTLAGAGLLSLAAGLALVTPLL